MVRSLNDAQSQFHAMVSDLERGLVLFSAPVRIIEFALKQ